MKKTIFFLFALSGLVCSLSWGQGQKFVHPKEQAANLLPKYPETIKNLVKGEIKDFVLRNDTVFMLTNKKTLWAWAIRTGKKHKIAGQVRLIHQNLQQQLFFALENGQIKRLESLDNQKDIIKIDEYFDYFVCNQSQDYFIVTPKGIKDLKTQKLYRKALYMTIFKNKKEKVI